MNKEDTVKKKKKILADVLDNYEKNNDFPEKKKFRVTRIEDWALLDDLIRQRYFSESYSEDRDKYVITLKGISLVDNETSKKIIKIGNQIIPALKELYLRDLSSDNRNWEIEDIANESGVSKDDLKKYLFLLEGMYLYFRGRERYADNKYFTKSIGIDERVLKATNVEDFIKDHLEEKEELSPSFFKYTGVETEPFDYGDERLVAFLDVLGFRKLIAAEDKIVKYFSRVTEFLSNLKGIEKNTDIQYALISDSIVLSFPFGGSLDNLNEFLATLGRLQADLCLEDIWLRGAVTIGKIKMKYEDQNQIVYGQALIDAYILETSYAKYPRIIIDPKVFKIINIDRGNLNSELNKLNSKTKIFKNILFDSSSMRHPIFQELQQPRTINLPNDGVWINYIENIHIDEERFDKFVQLLRKNLYSTQEHFDKYKWVQSYALLDCADLDSIGNNGARVECRKKLEAL